MTIRMGLEGKLYHGTAGTTAATELTITRDVTLVFDLTLADVSTRASIIDQFMAAGVGFTLDFEVINDDANSFVDTIRGHAAAGTAIALKAIEATSGWGFDGDFVIQKLDESQALRDRQAVKITARPTPSAGRIISFS